MTLRLCIAISALAVALVSACSADRAPWSGAGAAVDGLEPLSDVRPDTILHDLEETSADVANEVPDLVDLVPDPGMEVSDAADVLAVMDLADGEVCAPDCAGKECGYDGCAGNCGVCPDHKPFCNMAFQCEACEADCDGKICGSDGCGGSCGVCPVGWACDVGSCEPPACQGEQVLYEEDFGICNEGAIIVIDDQPDDTVTWLAMEEGAFSPPCAMYFGDPLSGSYDTGDPVSAALVLPTVTVPDDGDPYMVRFAVRMDAEPVVAPEYPYDHDVLYLRAYGEGIPGGGVALFDSKEFLNSTVGFWIHAAVSLAPYAGLSLQLRFEFDTIDSAANDYGGIWLDDLWVGTACPLCFLDDDCVSEEPCLDSLCTIFSNQEEFGTCVHPPKVPCCVELDPSFCDDFDPCTEDACDPETGDCTHLTIEDCVS